MNTRIHLSSGRRAAIAVALAVLAASGIGVAAAGSATRAVTAPPSPTTPATRLPNCGPDGTRVCNAFGCWCQ